MNNINFTFDSIWKDLDSPVLDPYKRAFNVALPFLCLYGPVAAALPIGLGIRKIYYLTRNIDSASQPPQWEKNAWIAAECTATLFHLGLTYVSPIGGALFSSGLLLGKQTYHMGVHFSKKEWDQFNKELLGTMVTVVHLFAIFSASPGLIAISITLRSLSELKESYSYYQEGKWPEMLTTLILAMIRLSGARSYASQAWHQHTNKSLTPQDADKLFKQLSQQRKNFTEKPPSQNSSKEDDTLCPSPTEETIDFGQILEQEGFSKTIEGVYFRQFSEHCLENLDFSGIRFKNCFLFERVMSNSTFNRCAFINCILDSTQIENTHFSFCRFDRVSLNHVTIQNSSFTNCVFTDSAFFHNTLERVDFNQSSLQGIYFNDSLLREVNWRSSALKESIFLGVQAENSSIENCDLTDAVFCEAENTLDIGISNIRESTKPIISITWDFEGPGTFAQIICKKLQENGMVPLKFQAIPIGVKPWGVQVETNAILNSLERVQVASARCIGEKLLAFRASGSEIDKIYNQAALISKFAHGHLLPGGEDIEPELYYEETSPFMGVAYVHGMRLRFPFYRKRENPEKFTKSLLELSILHHADLEDQQVMGICRGSQMINIFYSGTLCHHVTDQMGVQTLHALPLTSSKIEELKDDLFGSAEELHAFSLHHQCADEIGKGLHVLYESPTGVPKVLVHENGRVVATQFHPEVDDNPEIIEEDPNFLKSAPLFQGLFQRLAQKSQQK